MLDNDTRRLLTISALLLVALSTTQAQTPPSQPSSSDVSAIVSQQIERFFKNSPGSTGLSIGVIKDGKTYTFSYGVVDKAAKRPASPSSLYCIASITKTFTGTLLAQAVIEKKVKLEDDVRKYLQGNYPNLEFQGHFIQLGHLVNHNSGLPFNLPDIPENRPPFTTPATPAIKTMLANYDRESFLADLHKVELRSVPGEKFGYSNAAAVLLSLVLERIYKMPYEEIVKEKIGHPLGLEDTTISLNEAQESRMATGYDANGAIVPGQRGILLGAGALKSTVNDFLKYAAWELAEDDPAVKLSHVPRFILTDKYSVGLNWQMLHSGETRRIWQEGNLPGFISMCTLFPELKMAIIAFANEDDPVSSHQISEMVKSIATTLDPRSAPLL
jgi:serine-type D-Ala-D-Ala carboxypeptidase/endopeptidase